MPEKASYGICLSAFALDKAAGLKEKYPFLTHLQIKLPPPPMHTRLELPAKCKALREQDWALSFHAYPLLNFAETVASVHALWTELARETLAFAGQCGGEFCVFHGGYLQTKPTAANRTKGLNMLADSLETLLAFCEDQGVGLQLENIYSALPGSELIRLCDTPADFEALTAMVASEKLGICFDYGHASIFGDTAEILRSHFPLVKSLHLHENDGQKDLHLPLGSGRRDWAAELAWLREKGFCGTVFAENAPEQLCASLDFLKDHML